MSPTIKKELIKKILQSESIDGLFCTDDLTAILAYEAAQEVGIKVPKDLNLIGYDGTSLIRNYFPQLSTIQQPIEEISNLLIELLLKQDIQKKGEETLQYLKETGMKVTV